MGHHFSLVEYPQTQQPDQQNFQGNQQDMSVQQNFSAGQLTGVDVGQGMNQGYASANMTQPFSGQAIQQEPSIIGADPAWLPKDTDNTFLIRAGHTVNVRGSIGNFADNTSEKLNSFVSSIGAMFNGQANQNMPQNTPQNDIPIKDSGIVEVETGIAVQLASNEMLIIVPTTNVQLSHLSIKNTVMFPAMDENAHPEKGINLYLYNSFSSGKIIYRGDVLAIGIIVEIGQSTSGISLNKE